MKSVSSRVLLLVAAVPALLAAGCFNPTGSSSPDTIAGTPEKLAPAAVAAPGEAGPVGAPSGGILELYLTDYPLRNRTVQAVWINLEGVEVHGETSGWMPVPVEAKEYDLLQLVDDVALVGASTLEADTYTQIRLLLGEANRIVTDKDGEVSLKVPSGAQTGIKVNGSFRVEEGSKVRIVLDFDAQRSVKLTGKGFLLRPTIRIAEVSYETANQPPDPVTAGWIASDPGNVTQTPTFVYSGNTYYYQLQVPSDPDGDAVVIGSDPLPSYMSLDPTTGLVTIAPFAPSGTVTVNFWSEDSKGASTSGTPYTVTFSIVRT